MQFKLAISILATMGAAAVISACGDDDDDGTGGGATTMTGTTSTGSGAGGSGGSTTTGGNGGGGGQCYTCSELVTSNLPPDQACAGTSESLIGPLIVCLCDECGQPGSGGGGGSGPGPCFEACTQGTTPDGDCLACDQVAAQGPCETVWNDCMADTP